VIQNKNKKKGTKLQAFRNVAVERGNFIVKG
jgi:hypothetical protein